MFGFGLREYLIAGLVVMIPLTWQGARWYQSSIDEVRYNAQAKIDELEATKLALEQAREDAAEISRKLNAASSVEYAARVEIERELQKAEDEGKADDEKYQRELAEHKAAIGKLVAECSPSTPADPKPVVPECPDARGRIGGNQLDGLLKRFPPGPVRGSRPPATRSGRN